jgi:hypothetical protein
MNLYQSVFILFIFYSYSFEHIVIIVHLIFFRFISFFMYFYFYFIYFFFKLSWSLHCALLTKILSLKFNSYSYLWIILDTFFIIIIFNSRSHVISLIWELFQIIYTMEILLFFSSFSLLSNIWIGHISKVKFSFISSGT